MGTSETIVRSGLQAPGSRRCLVQTGPRRRDHTVGGIVASSGRGASAPAPHRQRLSGVAPGLQSRRTAQSSLGIDDGNPPPICTEAVDVDRDGGEGRTRQAVGPFDREHAVFADVVEPEVGGFGGGEAIQIRMEQRQASAAVLLHQRERRAADILVACAEAPRDTAYERRLARAKVTVEEQHVASGKTSARARPASMVSCSDLLSMITGDGRNRWVRRATSVGHGESKTEVARLKPGAHHVPATTPIGSSALPW